MFWVLDHYLGSKNRFFDLLFFYQQMVQSCLPICSRNTENSDFLAQTMFFTHQFWSDGSWNFFKFLVSCKVKFKKKNRDPSDQYSWIKIVILFQKCRFSTTRGWIRPEAIVGKKNADQKSIFRPKIMVWHPKQFFQQSLQSFWKNIFFVDSQSFLCFHSEK